MAPPVAHASPKACKAFGGSFEEDEEDEEAPHLLALVSRAPSARGLVETPSFSSSFSNARLRMSVHWKQFINYFFEGPRGVAEWGTLSESFLWEGSLFAPGSAGTAYLIMLPPM